MVPISHSTCCVGVVVYAAADESRGYRPYPQVGAAWRVDGRSRGRQAGGTCRLRGTGGGEKEAPQGQPTNREEEGRSDWQIAVRLPLI